MQRRPFTLVVIVLSLLGLAATARSAERKFTLRDYSGRGFTPDLVAYALDPKGAEQERLRLYTADNTPVPLQLTRRPDTGALTLRFVAELPPNATVAYSLRDDADSRPPAGALKVEEARPGLVFSNALLAVRVPWPINRTYVDPVPVRTLPCPILAFRSGDSPWLGASRFLSDKKVKALRIQLTERGPVFAELTYEIQWAAGGYYRARVRVIDRVPVVNIREEFDTGTLDGDDYWELNLTKGWTPDQAETAATNGNGGVDRGRVTPLAKFAEMKLYYLVPDSAWHLPLSHLGLFGAADKKARPDAYTMAGVIPLHKGDWRRMNAIEIQCDGAKDVRARFRLSYRWASWLREVTSETSPFSCQEHDMSLPKTYSRRLWGLALGRPAFPVNCARGACGPFYQLRLLYGVIGLDRYKDFILDWKQADVTYPRLYLKADTLARHRKALAASSLPETFKKRMLASSYALSGSDAVAQKSLKPFMSRLTAMCRFPFVSPTIGHHQTAGNYMIAAAADDLLSWPKLPADTRIEIRRRCALIAHLWEEPDVISYGDGSHSGNPNMGTARFMGAGTFLPLLPDHPLFDQWRTHMAAYTQYKIATQEAPGGGYFEYGSAYHMHGYSRTTNALPGLDAAGATNVDFLYRAYHHANWAYYMNLLTPVDWRWKARMIPGMANSPPGNTKNFLDAAGSFVGHDDRFAAQLLWAWYANGANERGNFYLAPVFIQPEKVALTSHVYPGVGVVFRAHQGPNETYMLFRGGFNWSHWYIDQGHFLLMSRGAVLVPFQPYQYWWSPNKEFDMYNTIRFGDPQNEFPHAWPDSNILDYAFGPTVDYAWSSTGYPDWFITPGKTPPFMAKTDAPVAVGQTRPLSDQFKQTQGAFEWNRQIMFLKGKTADSPNYFVVRDTMPGKGRLASYLYLNLLGQRQDVKITGHDVAVNTEWPVKLDVRFLDNHPLKPDFFEERQPIAPYNANWEARNAGTEPLSPNWVTREGAPLQNRKNLRLYRVGWERHVFMRIPRAPGQGYFWLLYPRKADEPRPDVQRLADGALKIKTPEGTDFVFVGPAPQSFAGQDVVFDGVSGSVRVRRDAVILALTAGLGRVGYKGHVIEGAAPFEQSIPLNALEPGVHKVAPLVSDIALPAAPTDAKTLAPGVHKVVLGKLTHYVVDSPLPVTFTDGDVRLVAHRAAVEIAPGSVRFVVPDRTYAKLAVGHTGLRGIGPFDLTFTDDGIAGKVAGRERSIAASLPEKLVRPMFTMDGVRYYAGWADDHSFRRFGDSAQLAFAFGITDGPHAVRVSEWIYPPLPAPPPRRALNF